MIDNIEIGVIVKSYLNLDNKKGKFNYDVYVRDYNTIKNYEEKDIQRYMVRHKFLSEEDYECQKYAMKKF